MVVGAKTMSRRFPPPWTVEDHPACFIVRDHDGQALAYVYFEEEPGRRSAAIESLVYAPAFHRLGPSRN
jgi:hypothetical protein